MDNPYQEVLQKWKNTLEQLTEDRIHETDFNIKNIMEDKENLIESFIIDLLKMS